MTIKQYGFNINEYTIFIFVLIIVLLLLIGYYNLKLAKVEYRYEKLKKNIKYRQYVKHLRKTRKN